ncbi:hypothetical protein HID58_038131, partial [Brassica napus]
CKGSSSLEPGTQLFVSCLQKAYLVYLFHVLNTDQVVRVIVIQKTLIEHVEKLRQVKAVLEEQRTFWNGAGRKFFRDIQEGSTEAAEVEW